MELVVKIEPSKERERLLSDGVEKVFGGMEKLAWGKLPLEKKIAIFDQWKELIPNLGVGDYVWLARDEKGDVLLMDNVNRLKDEEQIVVAEELLKDVQGQVKLVRYLGNFWGLGNEQVQKLINADSNHARMVVECLDNLEKVDCNNLAELMLSKGRGDVILSNIEKFCGSIKPQEIIERLYKTGDIPTIIKYLGDSNGDQVAIIDRLLRDGRMEETGTSLMYLKESLTMEHALALIRGGFGYYFLPNRDKFVGCNNEVVLEEMKKIGFFSGVVTIAEELGIENYSGLVLEMVNERGMSLDTVIGNLEGLRHLDSRVLEMLVQNKSEFDLVLLSLSSFARFSFESASLIVKLREVVTSLVISGEVDRQIYLDFNAMMLPEVTADQKWFLGKEWGFEDEKLVELWLDTGRFEDLNVVVSDNQKVGELMLRDVKWVKRVRGLLRHYHRFGEFGKVAAFEKLVRGFFPELAEEIKDSFPVEPNHESVPEEAVEREWYKPIELDPRIYRFYLEEGLLNEIVMMRLKGKNPWGNQEDLEFVESSDRLNFSRLERSLEKSSDLLFFFLRRYLLKAVGGELEHQRQFLVTKRLYVEDVDSVDMVLGGTSDQIRDYFVRAYRSFLDRGWMRSKIEERIEYGGKLWAEIASLGNWIWTEGAVDKKSFFIDRAVDLEHNNGHIFDKDLVHVKYAPDKFRKFLNHKKKGDVNFESELEFGLGAGYILAEDADEYRRLYRRLMKAPVRTKLGGD